LASWAERRLGWHGRKTGKGVESGLGCQGRSGRKQFWAAVKIENSFTISLQQILNLKPRFESKSNTLSNSNKFIPFLKIEIWNF
jgi:hypothetical protein